ncbi:MAG TPA: MFS transporter [Steroidobacteraceae bacterium]|jgi:MFS family permease
MRRADVPLAIALLTICNLFSVLDRTILNLLVDPIRRSLNLSDLQISFIQGPAFGILFVVATIPFGRLADVGTRKTLIAGAVAAWSLCTAATGMASNFLILTMTRAGVGAGESALIPAAHSMLANLVERGRLGRTISLFTMGGTAGIGFAMLGGGALVAALGTQGIAVPLAGMLQPWQIIFFTMGAMGLVLSLVVSLFVSEPPRGAAERSMSFSAVLQQVWRERTFYVPVYVAYSALAALNYGFLGWVPTYFARNHHVAISSVGLMLGMIFLATNTLGPFAAGWLSDRLYARYGSLGGVIVMRFFFALLIPAALLAFRLGDLGAAFGGCAAVALCIAALLTLGPVAIQTRAEPHMRGRLGAILVLCAHLAGVTLGPVVVAALPQLSFVSDLGAAISIHIICFALIGLAASFAARPVLRVAMA